MKHLILLIGLLVSIQPVYATMIKSIPDTLENGEPNPEFYKGVPVSAKKARAIIEQTVYDNHSEAINWWVDFINDKVTKESINGSACTLIDVSKASMEVQGYLEELYDQAGYYHTELQPGWTDEFNHQGGHPDGKTYLSLSW